MRKTIVVFLLVLSMNAAGQFAVNMDRAEVMKQLDAITVNDLAVNESGLVHDWAAFCKISADQLGVEKYSALEAERSEYGSYLMVRRLPNSMVAIEALPPMKRNLAGMTFPAGKQINDQLSTIAKSVTRLRECDSENFPVATIQGANSLSALVELVKTNTAAAKKGENSKETGPDSDGGVTGQDTKNEPETSEPVFTWLVREDKSKIDNTPIIIMTLRSNEEVRNGHGGSERPVFVIRCKEGKTDGFVETGHMLDNENVTIRLDNEKAYSLRMLEAAGGKALFFPNAIANIKKLWKHGKMVFRFTPFNSGAREVTFNIGGLEQEITPLRQACRW